MYRKILVPLDGSDLAECVFPHVEALAAGCKVNKILLIRVVEPFSPPSSSDYYLSPDEIVQVNAGKNVEAENYLRGVIKKTKFGKVNIEWKILTGRPAETLAG